MLFLGVGLGLGAQASGASTTSRTTVTLKRVGSIAVAGKRVRLKVTTRLRRGRYITRYTVSYGDRTRLRRGTGRPRYLRHTYTRPGRYRVKLTLIDNLRRRTVGRLWVTVRRAPRAIVPPTPGPGPGPGPGPTPTSPVGRIATGFGHACLVLPTGTVNCWGSNITGQLGNGTANSSSTPTGVGGIVDAIAVAAGAMHSCALRSGGTIACWGAGTRGQLGNGAYNPSLTPVPVSGITSAVAITAGGNHSCALLASGAVACWGSNLHGQIGNGGTLSAAPTPNSVVGITNATSVAAGGIHEGPGHSCAVLATGNVTCWGSNLRGELGNVGFSSSPSPVPVSAVTDAVMVAAGAAHSCAVHASGHASCWGSNASGQLGNSAAPALAPTPSAVTEITNAKAVAAGGATEASGHTCALLADGQVACWGSGGGNGAPFLSRTPTLVGGITDATWIAAGGNLSCALLATFAYRCWGTAT